MENGTGNGNLHPFIKINGAQWAIPNIQEGHHHSSPSFIKSEDRFALEDLNAATQL